MPLDAIHQFFCSFSRGEGDQSRRQQATFDLSTCHRLGPWNSAVSAAGTSRRRISQIPRCGLKTGRLGFSVDGRASRIPASLNASHTQEVPVITIHYNAVIKGGLRPPGGGHALARAGRKCTARAMTSRISGIYGDIKDERGNIKAFVSRFRNRKRGKGVF